MQKMKTPLNYDGDIYDVEVDIQTLVNSTNKNILKIISMEISLMRISFNSLIMNEFINNIIDYFLIKITLRLIIF